MYVWSPRLHMQRLINSFQPRPRLSVEALAVSRNALEGNPDVGYHSQVLRGQRR